MPQLILPPSSGSTDATPPLPTTRGVAAMGSHPLRIAAPSKQRRSKLLWPLGLLAVSLLLGVLGSLQIGQFRSPGGQGGAPVSLVSSQATSAPTQQPPARPTEPPALVNAPTPTIILTPQGTAGQQQQQSTPTPQPTTSPTTNPTMSLLVTDTFSRADQPSSWGTAPNGMRWYVADSDLSFSLVRQRGIVMGSGYGDAIVGPGLSDGMVVVSAALSAYDPIDTTDTTSVGAVLRWQDPDNWYKAFINGSALVIRMHANGQGKDLARIAFDTQPYTFYSIRFRAVGSTLLARAWQTGTAEPTTWMVKATDATFSSGQGGIRLGLQDGVVANVTSFSEYRL